MYVYRIDTVVCTVQYIGTTHYQTKQTTPSSIINDNILQFSSSNYIQPVWLNDNKKKKQTIKYKQKKIELKQIEASTQEGNKKKENKRKKKMHCTLALRC